MGGFGCAEGFQNRPKKHLQIVRRRFHLVTVAQRLPGSLDLIPTPRFDCREKSFHVGRHFNLETLGHRVGQSATISGELAEFAGNDFLSGFQRIRFTNRIQAPMNWRYPSNCFKALIGNACRVRHSGPIPRNGFRPGQKYSYKGDQDAANRNKPQLARPGVGPFGHRWIIWVRGFHHLPFSSR